LKVASWEARVDKETVENSWSFFRGERFTLLKQGVNERGLIFISGGYGQQRDIFGAILEQIVE